MTNSVVGPERSISAWLAISSSRLGSSVKRQKVASAVRRNVARRAASEPVADHVADDEHGGVGRAGRDEVEVAGHAVLGGEEAARELEARARRRLARA